MNGRFHSAAGVLRWAAVAACVAIAQPAHAQTGPDVTTLRQQYDALMSNFERLAAARGDTANQQLAQQGRQAMRQLTDQRLTALYSNTRLPDLSVAVTASEYLVSRWTSHPAAPNALITPKSPGFPQPIGLPSGCDGVDIDPGTRYALLIAKEVANSILAAAAWVCNEDILGENGSAACVPLAIAADIANGFFDTATFCAGEVTANQVDANFNRLDHIHNDLGTGIDTIVATSNANTTTIVNTSNANTTTIVNNDNSNTSTIVANDNANTSTILNNANANKDELRDLILKTQIEADLAMVDGAAVVAAYELPSSQGGYLDLVQAIVTETIAKVIAAGGSVGNAQAMLNTANAAKAAGDFKAAYASYRKAYKAAGK